MPDPPIVWPLPSDFFSGARRITEGTLPEILNQLKGALATLAELVALAGQENGSLFYVAETDDIYVLHLTGSYTPDGITVLAAADGGYWVSRSVGRWDDLQGDVVEGKAVAALTLEEFRDTPFRMFFFRHDQDDSLSYEFQFPHRWDPSLLVVPHLHLLPAADPLAGQNAYFTGYYAWSKVGEAALPALAGWTPFTATLTVQPGEVYKQKILSLGALSPPSWARISSFLMLHIERSGTNINDTYSTNKDHGTVAANLGVLGVDVHYRLRQHGSIAETHD